MNTTRSRRLAAASALALGAFLLLGAPAGAQDEAEHSPVEDVVHEAEENGATHADALCIETLAEGGSVDDCHQAPNPILPEWNEVIWGAVGFAVVFALLRWKAYPAIKGGMDARTEKIRGDIEAAEATRAEAQQVKASYEAQLADAKSESARIIEEARQTADSVRTERIAAIDGEIAEMRQRAAAEVEAAKAQALEDLRGEVTALALGAAERVVEHNLDDATNRALIDSYIDQVGADR